MDLTLLYIPGCIVFLLIAGYTLCFLSKKWLARTFAWAIAIAMVWVSTTSTSDQLPLTRMLVIVFLQLLSMKILVAVETYTGNSRLTIWQWMAFALGWFGMRPVLFEKLPSASLAYGKLALKGLSRIAIGFFLLCLSAIAEEYPATSKFFLPQLLLLTGVSFILHFGILNLSAASWRFAGVDVHELFRSPYRSQSLKEFWGKRWNIAFSEMTALIAYRPLKAKTGVEVAVVISFLLSGLLHEIAISLPVRSGYGLPMIYFIVQAIVMQLEAKSSFVQKIIGHRILSHVWVMAFLILPMPLLFHSEFMLEVLEPLRNWLLSLIGF
jgi:hypothetical protein